MVGACCPVPKCSPVPISLRPHAAEGCTELSGAPFSPPNHLYPCHTEDEVSKISGATDTLSAALPPLVLCCCGAVYGPHMVWTFDPLPLQPRREIARLKGLNSWNLT